MLTGFEAFMLGFYLLATRQAFYGVLNHTSNSGTRITVRRTRVVKIIKRDARISKLENRFVLAHSMTSFVALGGYPWVMNKFLMSGALTATSRLILLSSAISSASPQVTRGRFMGP